MFFRQLGLVASMDVYISKIKGVLDPLYEGFLDKYAVCAAIQKS